MYVALVHGIGAEGPKTPRGFAAALSVWWTTADRATRAVRVPCPAGEHCDLEEGHRHLRLTHGDRSIRVDLDPIFWADEVTRPGRMRCAVLLFKVALLVGLVDVLAAMAHGIRPIRDFAERQQIDVRGVPRTISSSTVRAIGVFARASLAPLFALIAPAAVLTKRGHRMFGDALAWGADPDARAAVTRHVEERILRRARGRAVVLVGHSQGGSILTEVEPAVRRTKRDRRDVRLVTLGSGHGLLAAVDKLLPTWRLGRSAVLWGAILSWLLVVVLTSGGIVLGAVPAAALVVSSLFRWGAGVWLSGIDPAFGLQQANRAATDVWLDVAHQLESQPYTDAATMMAGAACGLFGLGVFQVARLLIGNRAEQLMRAVRTNARGIDIVASHDVVSAALLELGEEERLRPVRNCGSLVADHVTYFSNGCSVLPLVAAEVEAAGRFALPVSEVVDSGRPYHEAGLRRRRRTHLWFGAFTALTVAAAVSQVVGGPWPWVAALAAVTGVSGATTARNVRWLKRAARDAGASPARVEAMERLRCARRKPLWTLWLAAVAVPLIGGGLVMAAMPDGSVRFEALDGPNNPWGYAFATGCAIAVAAWFSAFGSRRADYLATGFCLLAALVWLAQDSAWGVFCALFPFTGAVWGYARLLRHSSPLPAPGPLLSASRSGTG